MKPRSAVLATLVALLPLTACGSGGGGSDDTTITVLAASSLTGTFTELGQEFESAHPGVTVKFAFDSSATLAQQAVGGAPADVLATADTTTMDGAKAVQASTPKVFATNVMVLATPADNPAHVTSFADLDKSSVKFVVCVPTAPCGAVAQALLDQDHVTGRPVSTEVDVKSVLAKLTEGEADAGIVYTTDATAAGDQVATVKIPGAGRQVTTYPIVTLDQSKDSTLAQEFVSLVTGSTGQQVLAKAGFGAP
ncbi:MAG: molybdate transport system substrate-binding protein [Nocardioidaceae bacterium]|nr:molybdate transport system substrate-binding protein [Nocardioidaceae bacterium]